MEILLGNENYFVEGSKNAAIYSLNTNKVYALNESAKKIIMKYAKEERLNKRDNDFIEDLIEKQLINPKEINLNIKFEKPIANINFAWLELTANCNLKCVHCYGEFGNEMKRQANTMEKKDWFNVIDQLYDLGCRHIQLIGGEPFCNVYCNDIIEYLHKKGFKRITVFTNATLINNKTIEILKKCNVKVRFSLYGFDSESHEKITQVKGSFNYTKKAIEDLKKENINVSVAVVIMKENEMHLEKIKQFIEKNLKIRFNGYDVIRPSCVNENLHHRISNYDILSNRYYTIPKFSINKNQFIRNHYYNPCLNSKIAITSTGDIIPCIFARDFVSGNVKDCKISELKDRIINSWEITKNTIEECKDCEFKYACSDCRPLAIGINGDKFSKYPRCCYSPKDGIWEDIKIVTKEIINNK